MTKGITYELGEELEVELIFYHPVSDLLVTMSEGAIFYYYGDIQGVLDHGFELIGEL